MARRKAPLVWFEIPVTDFDQAIAFYQTLFGWVFHENDTNGQEYRLIDAGDRSIDGGLVLRTDEEAPTGRGPVFYIDVKDIEMTILRAQKIGGTLERKVTFLSRESGVVASVRDPDGNIIGLWSSE
jgi:predicted enzyme related to lactoylglutathione lyase